MELRRYSFVLKSQLRYTRHLIRIPLVRQTWARPISSSFPLNCPRRTPVSCLHDLVADKQILNVRNGGYWGYIVSTLCFLVVITALIFPILEKLDINVEFGKS